MSQEKFEMWAFGQICKNGQLVPAPIAMDLWNERHEELLKIDPSGIVSEDLEKMKDIYNIMRHYPEGMYGYVEKLLNSSYWLHDEITADATRCEFDDLNRDHPRD